MSKHLIYAHTDVTPQGGYPAFINVSGEAEKCTVIVRSEGNGGKDITSIVLSKDQLAELATKINEYLNP